MSLQGPRSETKMDPMEKIHHRASFGIMSLLDQRSQDQNLLTYQNDDTPNS